MLDRATILDSTDGSVILELSESTAGSRSLDWSPDGRLLAIAIDEITASVWETVTGQKVAVLRGHTDWVLDVQWSLDGKQLATAGSGTFKIWDWPVRDNPQSISIGDGLISSIFWDEVNSQLITGGPTGVYRHDLDQQTSEEQISSLALVSSRRFRQIWDGMRLPGNLRSEDRDTSPCTIRNQGSLSLKSRNWQDRNCVHWM